MSDQPRPDDDERPTEHPLLTDGGDSADAPEACRLKGFSRNRYFHGKLMTARDMELDQDYHAGRFETFLQHVAGEGVVCGLTAELSQASTDDDLVVDVSEGWGIDCCGRPVVLPKDDEESFTAENENVDPDDGTSVYLTYRECEAEQVPITGSEDACGEECTYNRIVEEYAIEIEDGKPDNPKPVRSIEFPKEGDMDDEEGEYDPALHDIARSYYETEDGATHQCEEECDHRIFLGYFGADVSTGGDGVGWGRKDEEHPRPYVYDNDMLYAAIARHATDFENPHDVVASVDSVEPDNDGDVDLISEDGTVERDPDAGEAHQLSLDVAEEYRGTVKTVETVEPDEDGDVDIFSESGTVDADPDAGGEHELSLDVVEKYRGTVKSVEGVEPDEDGDVGLYSEDEQFIEVNPHEEDHEIGIAFHEDEVGGGVETIETVPPDGEGNVDFISTTETIMTDPDEDSNRVHIDLADHIRRKIDRIDPELDAHCRYLLDKTLKTAVQSFYRVADRYSDVESIRDPAIAIVREAGGAVANGVFQDPDEYVDAVEDIEDSVEEIFDVLSPNPNLVRPESMGRYGDAHGELESILDRLLDRDDVTCTGAVELAVALDWVSETARWLHRPDTEEPPTVPIPGTDDQIVDPVIHDLVGAGGSRASGDGGIVWRDPVITDPGDTPIVDPPITRVFDSIAELVAADADYRVTYEPPSEVEGDVSPGEVVYQEIESTADGSIIDATVAGTALGDVSQVGPSREETLNDAGIFTAEQLANATVADLSASTGLPESTASQLIDNADDLVSE